MTRGLWISVELSVSRPKNKIHGRIHTMAGNRRPICDVALDSVPLLLVPFSMGSENNTIHPKRPTKCRYSLIYRALHRTRIAGSVSEKPISQYLVTAASAEIRVW